VHTIEDEAEATSRHERYEKFAPAEAPEASNWKSTESSQKLDVTFGIGWAAMALEIVSISKKAPILQQLQARTEGFGSPTKGRDIPLAAPQRRWVVFFCPGLWIKGD
jgi:hypothetical protein